MITFTHYPLDDINTPMTQRFGENPERYKPYRLPGHEGLDFAAPEGEYVFAVAPGVVTEANYGQRRNGNPHPYGLHVRVGHANGCETVYAHLGAIDAAKGDAVAGGDVLGRVGSSGNSSGPHLHLTLKIPGGQPGWPYDIVDPMPYLVELVNRLNEGVGETAVSPTIQLRVIFKRLGVNCLGDALVRIGELEQSYPTLHKRK